MDHVYRLEESMKVSTKNLDEVAEKLQKLMNYFISKATMTEALTNLLQVGTLNFEATKLLDEMNTKFNGVPVLTAIPV